MAGKQVLTMSFISSVLVERELELEEFYGV